MNGSRFSSSGEKDRRAPILCLLAGALVMQLGYGFMDRAPDYDEAIYMDLARGITRCGIPQPRPDARIFLQHPPLFYYLESILFLAGEPPLIVARLLATILSLLTLWVLFSLVKRAWNRKRAWVASGLLAVNPCFIYYSHSVYMESAVTFFSLLGLSWWLRAAEENQAVQRRPSRVALKAGLLLGVAILVKYLGGLYVAGIVIRQVISRRYRILGHWLFWVFLSGVFLVAVLWPLYAFSVSPHQFLSGLQFWFSRPESQSLAVSWRTSGFLQFCAYAVGVLTPVFILLVLAGFVRESVHLIRRKTGWLAREILWTSAAILGCFLFFFLLATRRDVKYLAVILPLLVIFASGPICSVLDHKKKWVTAVFATALIFLVGPGTYLYDPMGSVWRPNLVLFGLQRDGRYVDLMEMGRTVRAERRPGSKLLAEFKGTLLGYYGDLEVVNGWGMRWVELSPRLDESTYYLKASDAPELPAEEVDLRDKQLAAEFIELKRARRGEIIQTLYRRVRAPDSDS